MENIGKKFNKLTIIEKASESKNGKRIYKCKCECGGEKEVAYIQLKSGRVKSCGCLRMERYNKQREYVAFNRPKNDLTGKVFGELTVIKFAGRTADKQAFWLCKCSCGNEKEVSGQHLNNGATRSCGHLNMPQYRNKLGKRKEVCDFDCFNCMYADCINNQGMTAKECEDIRRALTMER